MAKKNFSEDVLDELRVDLQRRFNYAQGYVDIAVKGYAREAWEYFYGNLPAPVTAGSSSWVDRTVWESVNGTLQDIINVFCSGDEAVTFVADNQADSDAADVATKLVNQILLRDNPGYNVISSAAQECLVTRNSFIKYYWDEQTSTQTEEAEGVPPEALAAYVQGLEAGGLEELEVFTTDNDDGTVDVKVNYKQTVKRVKVEYVPSEQIFVDEHATSFADAQYFCHRVRRSKEDLVAMGFPKDEIESFNDWTDTMDTTQSTVAWSRTDWRQDIDSDIGVDTDDIASMVWVYEHYIRTGVLDKNKEAKLYQVIQAGEHILSCEEVTSIPFVTFCPYPIPGSFYGQSVYDITKDIQDLRTALVRGYIDNVNNANYGRYKAIVGAYDRRSLLDNRPGGVVEMERQDAIDLFPYHNLPQGIDGLLGMSEELKETRTGVTKLGMGINPDVFKNDNAYATVGLMMNAAQNRLRMVCRNIAHNGMVELMRGIYNLIRENGETPLQVQTPRGMVQVNPKQLPPRHNLQVVVAISPNEKAERAQKLISLKQLIAADQQLAPLFTLEQDRYMTAQIFELMGIKDTHKYLMPLEQYQPPQPSPMEILQLEMTKAQVENVQASSQKMIADAFDQRERTTFEQQKAADEFSLKQEELQFKQENAADAMTLENRKEDNSATLEQAKHKLSLLQQQVRQYESVLKELQMVMDHQVDQEKIVAQAQIQDKTLELQKKESNVTKKDQQKTLKDSRIPNRRLGSKK